MTSCSDGSKNSLTVRSAVGKLMSEGKAGYLYPEAPRSPKQRICLTSDKKP